MFRGLAFGARPRLLAIGILAVSAGWLATTSLQQDFAAYYTAGAAVGRGLTPYVNHLPEPDAPWDGVAPFRHSRFLYPPLVAEVFRLLAALPFAGAKIVFSMASVAALVVALGLVARDPPTGGGSDRRPLAMIAPVLFAIWLPVLVTLERGQIDLLVLVALAIAWHWRDRSWVAGGALAVAAMAKPLVLGVVPLLLFARRFRWAATTIGALVLLAGANVAVCGWEASGRYLREVLPRAARYGEGGTTELLLTESETARANDDWEAGVARIDGKGRAWAPEVGAFPRSASLSRLLAGNDVPSPPVSLLIYLVLGVGLAVAAFRSPDSPLWYWGGLAAAVVAAPISWAMSLVWALPLYAWIWSDPARRRGPALALTALAFAAGMVGPLGPALWVVAGLAAVAAAVAGAATGTTATGTTATGTTI